MKDIMSQAEAQGLAEKATQGLLDALSQHDHPLEVGVARRNGTTVTQAQVDRFKRTSNRAYLKALRSRYELVAL